MGAEAGHVIRTTIGGRNSQTRQVSRKPVGDPKFRFAFVVIDD